MLYFFHGATGSNAPVPIHYRGFTITLRNTTFGDQSIAETSTDNTQHSQETDIRAPAGFEHAITTSGGRKPTPQTAPSQGSVLYLVLEW